MSEPKTKPSEESVETFLASVEDRQKRSDCLELAKIMKEVTGHDPVMWGGSMVGFGRYHYRYDSGREGDWFVTGFAPRKRDLTIYIMPGFDKYGELMKKIGKHRTGKSCLYVKQLADVDVTLLKSLVEKSVRQIHEIYGASE